MGQSAEVTVLETYRYKHLGIVVNTEGNLKDHTQEMGQKWKKNIIRGKCNRGKESGGNRRNQKLEWS